MEAWRPGQPSKPLCARLNPISPVVTLEDVREKLIDIAKQWVRDDALRIGEAMRDGRQPVIAGWKMKQSDAGGVVFIGPRGNTIMRVHDGMVTWLRPRLSDIEDIIDRAFEEADIQREGEF